MKPLLRNTDKLTQREYDLVIVGGGIFGAAAAWDAALRGLSVALIEKQDFCHATSANHFKMVHGGIRYLQHGDIPRIRESSKERSALLRIAPHLVRPLPILIPTYRHGLKGKAFLRTGVLVYDLLTLGRNRGLMADREIPFGKFFSREDVLRLFPNIKREGLTGGAVFCDGQMYNPPRLVLSFLRSAVDKGAEIANYLTATDFIREGNRILGVKANDAITGRKLEIRGRCVLNTAGPWAARLLESSLGIKLEPPPNFSRDLAFVIKRRPSSEIGLAVSTRSKDTDTIIDRGGRHLFVVPWRNYMLVGVWHVLFDRPPEEISVSKEELQAFVDEINAAYPGFNLSANEITRINTGLTLFGDEKGQGTNQMSFGKRSILIDHAREHKIEGFITLIGVRATTAQGMASKAMRMIERKLSLEKSESDAENTPIFGGALTSFDGSLTEAIQRWRHSVDSQIMTALVHNYGSEYESVLKYTEDNPQMVERLGDSLVLKAEVVHGVREEMALKLADVVLRRTDLGTGMCPGEETLRQCAELMATELGWEEERIGKEMEEVLKAYSWNGAQGDRTKP